LKLRAAFSVLLAGGGLAGCCLTPVGVPDAGPKGCTISGSLYAPGTPDPTDSCHVCTPSLSDSAWSAAITCGTGSFCAGGQCVAGCSIGGANFADRANNPVNPLQCCNAQRAASAWTLRLDDGGFYPVDGGTTGLAVADLDVDGWPDLATSLHDGVAVFRNAGGTFSAVYGYGGTLASDGVVVAGDVSGDGRPDLVVGGPVAPLQVLINLDGGFTSELLSWSVNWPALGDIDADGVTDIVGIDVAAGALAVWKGIGGGAFAASPTLFPVAVASGISDIALGDFRGVRILDVVVGHAFDEPPLYDTPPHLGLYVNDGLGSFQPERMILPLAPDGLIAADLNNDGHLDLAISDYISGVELILGNGDGTFQAASTIAVDAGFAGGFGDIAVARLDTSLEASARPEILTIRNAALGLLWPAADGGYVPFHIPLPTYLEGLATADFNRDGATDVAVSIIPGGIQILLNGCP
jgi:hypothetical protein